MSSSEIFLGLGLLIVLAVGCQVLATRLRLPAIVLLLPVGFIAGNMTDSIDADGLFGDTFTPLVGLAVAVILFDGGLDLRLHDLEGHSQRVVRRLLLWGIPLTWAGATAFTWLALRSSWQTALMIGAILIVSGPTVVAPLLERARPGRRLTAILSWESVTIDPIGAIVAALTFHALSQKAGEPWLFSLGEFGVSVGIGVLGAVVGTVLLWLLVDKAGVTGVLATEATIATVIGVAAVCNAVRDDTGLIAAIGMGVAVANVPFISSPEDRPFFMTIVQLIIGLLFVSISATVTTSSVIDLLAPAVAIVAALVLIVRPVVTAVATLRTDLTRAERLFIGLMDPRGIVAASTAATFAVPLARANVGGAEDLLPVTFLVIVGTVTIYGLLAVPAARRLGLTTDETPALTTPRDVRHEL